MSGRIAGQPHELRGNTEAMRLLGKKGGYAKANKLSSTQRVDEMRKCCASRNAKMTAEERSASARRAALARWSKKRE